MRRGDKEGTGEVDVGVGERGRFRGGGRRRIYGWGKEVALGVDLWVGEACTVGGSKMHIQNGRSRNGRSSKRQITK
jgi:hypothetical protein